MPHTTKIRFHAIYDLFLADLNNGGIRVGMVGGEIFDYQKNHPRYEEVSNLTPHTIEEFYDECYLKYAGNP